MVAVSTMAPASALSLVRSSSWLDVLLGAFCCHLVWLQMWRVRELEQWFSLYPTRDFEFFLAST